MIAQGTLSIEFTPNTIEYHAWSKLRLWGALLEAIMIKAKVVPSNTLSTHIGQAKVVGGALFEAMIQIRLLGALLVIALTSISAGALAAPSTTMDVLAAFRSAITADPTGALSTWSTNQSNANYCSWEGVLCHSGTRQVKGILLGDRQLQGNITPLLGQLSSLSYLNLSFNRLSGVVPKELGECISLTELSINDNGLLKGSIPHEFSNLTRLRVLVASANNLSGELPPLSLPLLHHLNLSTNALQGKLTTQFAGCPALQILDLSENAFEGSIPASLGNLSHLAYLDLAFNNFSSILPPSVANCTLLYHLNLYNNHLSGNIPTSWFPQLHHSLRFFSLGNNGCSGSVPSTIASLSKLEYIELGGNHFDGQILQNLLNCTNLSILDLWDNSFNESLPVNLGTALPKLTLLGLIGNNFYGKIPSSLSNCSELGALILGFNYGITGTIPKEIFRLQKVSQYDFQHDALTGDIPPEIGNASSTLAKLLLNNNKFTGTLPPQLGLLPVFEQLNFEYNQITGGIPSELGNCTTLFLITGNRNLLKGSIPSTLGNLKKLEHFRLDNNQLSGVVPSSLANCTRMTNISLNNNLLEGPLLAASLPNILYYDISNNRLSGPLPPELGSMTQVQLMDFSFNNLSGSIPASLASCVNLYYLNLSSNHLSGSIPSQLADSLASLVMLNLSRNSLSGSIPTNIGDLAFLQKLDLSFNSLSGEIPKSLSLVSNLSFLNVSYNNLEGEVPDTGAFRSLSSSSFLGNPGLCGLKLHIACPHRSNENKHMNVLLISLVIAGAVLVIALIGIFVYFLTRAKGMDVMLKPTFLRLTLREIQEATDNFSPANVLGAGGTGVVYKGVTKDGKILAFKKLDLPRNSPVSPFFAEVKSMGQVRHRNLIRLLGYYSDLENDILILEYMPNGDLSQQLHSSTPSATSDQVQSNMIKEPFVADSALIHHCLEHDHVLPWPDRVRLARGIAAGLAYLHHDCPTPIIHLDIKPTNILLDEDLEPRITDFGLAKIMQDRSTLSASSLNMRGTLGYVAPEYANMGKITLKCDVYSFGILLLEILTRRSPTDNTFVLGQTLATWVLSFKTSDGSFDECLVKLCIGAELISDGTTQYWKQVNLLLNVGLLCTKENPKDRPRMHEVVEMMSHLDDNASSLSMQQQAYLQSLLS